jgi:hypothetical protein
MFAKVNLYCQFRDHRPKDLVNFNELFNVADDSIFWDGLKEFDGLFRVSFKPQMEVFQNGLELVPVLLQPLKQDRFSSPRLSVHFDCGDVAERMADTDQLRCLQGRPLLVLEITISWTLSVIEPLHAIVDVPPFVLTGRRVRRFHRFDGCHEPGQGNLNGPR